MGWSWWGAVLVVYLLAGCAPMRTSPPAPPPVIDGVQLGVASWYGPGFHGNRTANGEIYDQYELTAAHRTLPLGTRVMVTNLSNGRAVEVRINDRGPFVGGRAIGLAYGAASVSRRAVFLAVALAAGCVRGRIVHDGRVNADALATVVRDLPALRGQDFGRPVPAVALPPADVAAWLRRDIDLSYPGDDLERVSAVYQRLGLLPAGTALRAALEDLYRGQIAAFYDPRSKQLVLATEALGTGGPAVRLLSLLSGRDLIGELLVAHELTHALQDQHWGLPTEPEPLANSYSDRILARRALLEGDATLAGFAYVQRGTPSRATIDRIERQLHAIAPTLAAEYPRVPEIVRASLAFQYDAGTAFAGWALAEGGWTAVDRAEADPPESTEQVLHPARYFGVRDRPFEIALHGTEEMEAAGWRRVLEDTLGELSIRILARRARTEDAAAAVADGWGGDRLRALARGDELVLVWATAWDGPGDAIEFLDAMRETMPDARVERRGQRVLVLVGPSSLLDGLSARIWGRTTARRTG